MAIILKMQLRVFLQKSFGLAQLGLRFTFLRKSQVGILTFDERIARILLIVKCERGSESNIVVEKTCADCVGCAKASKVFITES